MGKLKTHKGVKRRIKVTGSGTLMAFRPGRRHLLTGKSANRTRRMRRAAAVSPVNEEKLRRLIPYQ